MTKMMRTITILMTDQDDQNVFDNKDDDKNVLVIHRLASKHQLQLASDK